MMFLHTIDAMQRATSGKAATTAAADAEATAGSHLRSVLAPANDDYDNVDVGCS